MIRQCITDALLTPQVVTPTTLIPTGTPFVDELFGGGLEPGHVYTILGDTGVGRSMLATRIATGAAWHFHQRDPSKSVVYFNMNMKRTEWTSMVLAISARIDRNSLHGPHVARLAPSQYREQYENDEFYSSKFVDPWHRDIQIVCDTQRPGEFERRQLVLPWVGQHLGRYDFLSARPTPVVSAGWLEWALLDILSRTRMSPGLLCLDPLDRYVQAMGNGEPGRDYRHTAADICTMADRCRLLAQSLSCPVLLVHSLNGVGSKLPPTRVATHRECCMSKTLAKYFDTVIVLGVHDDASGMFQCACRKSHRPVTCDRVRVLKLEGRFGVFHDVTDQAEVDVVSGQIRWKTDRPVFDFGELSASDVASTREK